MSVRDYHPRAARRGSISGCSVVGDRCAAPYQPDLGVEIHGEFRGCTEASDMGGKVPRGIVPADFPWRGFATRTGVAEHVLLLGEATEKGLGRGVVAG